MEKLNKVYLNPMEILKKIPPPPENSHCAIVISALSPHHPDGLKFLLDSKCPGLTKLPPVGKRHATHHWTLADPHVDIYDDYFDFKADPRNYHEVMEHYNSYNHIYCEQSYKVPGYYSRANYRVSYKYVED